MEIRDIDLDGQLLHVGIRHGRPDRPPLLLFNGIGANLELVNPLLETLREPEAVIFDTGQMDVLGVSWGGALAQQFAHQFSERCRRLVLASTSPGAIMVPGKLSVLMKLMMPRRYTDPDYLHEIGGEIYGGVYRRDPALLKEHSRHIRSPGGRGYLYQLIATWGWTSLPWLHSLRQPTLVMHGNDDPIVPLINARILVASIPNAELHVVNDGHLFLVTQAREVAAILERFLAQDVP